MPYGVLPALLVVEVVGEAAHDEAVDLAERHAPLRAGRDGHGDEGDVGVGRLLPGLLERISYYGKCPMVNYPLQQLCYLE